MGHCRKRHILLSLCVIQLLATLERQVFDFLGFMWAPILANFLNILFIIFGFFGTFQYVAKYILSYAVWNLFWLAWNVFIICYYLNVGILNRESGILSLGTGSVSWWETNGWGCHAQWDAGGEAAAAWLRPSRVTGCVLHYSYVESAHAAFHCLLALIAFILATYHTTTLAKSDDNAARGSIKSSGHQSLYSIEFSRPAELRTEPPTKPMTPRRVKRRSVSSRHSTRQSSRRSSQRRSASHPHQATSTGHTNPTYRQSSQQSLNDSYNEEELYNNRPASVRSSYSNFHGTRPISLNVENTAIYPESSYNDTYLSRTGSNHSLTEATPQVPQKRTVPDPNAMNLPYRAHSSQSAFLNNGPPAYHLHQGSQYFPPPPDNETAM